MDEFNFNEFTLWRQDNRDYSDVDTADVYICRLGQDIIHYCLIEVGMCRHEAYAISNKYFISEAKRLNVELSMEVE